MTQKEQRGRRNTRRWYLVTEDTPLRLLLLTQNKEQAEQIGESFLHAGTKITAVAKTVAQARKMLNTRIFHGLLFDRALVDDYEEFFDSVGQDHLWFIPIACERDDQDGIDALNTGMVAYYLLPPFSVGQAENALKYLRWRIIHDKRTKWV